MRFRFQTSRMANTRARMPRVTPTPMHALNPLLRPFLVCRLANSPVADVTDVAAVVGILDDENEIADAEVEIESDVVEDVDVVVDVNEDEKEAGVIVDTGVGVGVIEDVYAMISAVIVDHVIGERSDLRFFSKSESSP